MRTGKKGPNVKLEDRRRTPGRRSTRRNAAARASASVPVSASATLFKFPGSLGRAEGSPASEEPM
eukprot:3922636-Rhodomonas_salina.1